MLFWLETKKIVTSVSLIGFLILCLALNTLLIVSNGRDELPDASQLEGMSDVFDGYGTAYIGEAYIKAYELTGAVADAMREKYAKLQASADTKAANDESLTLYYAGRTHDKHMELFGMICNILLMEGALTAALIMLLSVGYEHANNTALVVYAAKTGRKILRPKLLASVAAGLTAYALLTAATLTLYFSLNDFGSAWDSSISSVFNYIVDYTAGNRPFITWRSYTVFTYLLASLGVSALLTLCFALMAFIIGTWVKNSYIGFLIFIAVNAVMVTAGLYIPPTSVFTYAASHTPVWLWLRQAIWFTDGASITLWANFETLGACVSMILLATLAMFSAARFRKRDIV